MLREEYRLRVFENNRILRRIFGPNWDKHNGWRGLRNKELHSLYRSPTVVRMIECRRLRLSGHVARMEELYSSLKILKGKPIGKRPLGKRRRRWKDGY
jgi:hypothetical protein